MTDSMLNKAYEAGQENNSEPKVKRFPKLRRAIRWGVITGCVVLIAVAGVEVYGMIYPDPWYVKALNLIGF